MQLLAWLASFLVKFNNKHSVQLMFMWKAEISSKPSFNVSIKIKYRKTSFEKKKLFFCVNEYAEYGFDQQRLIWHVCRLWDMVFS